MARKRKNPQQTNRSGVIPLDYWKQDFEKLTFTIVEYTLALRRRNRDIAHREVSKDEVREQFTVALLTLYHLEDPTYKRLIGQAESPAYHNYWFKHADRVSYLQEKNTSDSTTGFRISDRKLKPALMKQYPHCILMEHETLGVIIVPDLNLRALNQVFTKDIVKPILEANTDILELYLHMRPLCEAIIRRVYYFEEASDQQSKLEEMNSWEQDVGQLLEGYRLAYENDPRNRIEAPTGKVSLDKGKKRLAEEELEPEGEKAPVDEGRDSTEGEEDEEVGSAGDGPGPSKRRKRSKRSNLEEGRWLDFEKELGSASASTPAAPVPFQFPNIILPIRNKD